MTHTADDMDEDCGAPPMTKTAELSAEAVAGLVGLTGRVIYLSGPISGVPGKNHALFMAVAGKLRAMGNEVYNPREFCWTENVFPKRKAFATYCDFICNRADTIVMLPGWRNSKGATTEHGLAENCGLDVVEWQRELTVPMVDDVGGGP